MHINNKHTNCVLISLILILSSCLIRAQEKSIDSTIVDTITKSKFLIDKVDRKAKGYVSVDNKNKIITLFDRAELYYTDIELQSGIIKFNWETNIVSAGRIKDSLGNLVQSPIFKQAGEEINPDSIRYNFETKKALIWNSKTKQNEMNVFSEATKKENDSVYFIKEAKVTTSRNIEDPEYYIRIRSGKFIPNNKIIAGPSNLYIYDVPTPIFLPFGYFPLAKDRNSGFIFPSIGQTNRRGYFFQNGGYYIAASDFFDLTLLGDYYTNGSYGFRVESTYKKRYNYNGRLSIRFENLIDGERGLPGYSKSNIYNFRWSHSQDSKANPNSRFSASVNLGSSNYFRESLNQINTPNFLNNSLNSSVSYSKTFRGYPSVNMSLSASHSQNTRSNSVNLVLPTFQGSVERIYPFVKRNGQKKGILKNINMQYNFRGENRVTTTDSLFLKKEMFDDAKYGMKHSVPISTNFKVLKHLSVSMSGNYEEVWTGSTIKRNDYDSETENSGNKVIIKGFDRFSQYNFGMGVGTTIYGLFNFKKESKIEALRHVIRPSINYSIRPSFDEYYDTYIIDANGNTEDYTRFEGGLYGRPGNTKSSSIGITVRNNLEAKVKDRDSTKTALKKIKILNNLNFSTNYNITADSLRWSPIRMSTVIPLLDNKLNINMGATFDPYALDENKKRFNTFSAANGGPLLRMTSANINWGYNFKSKGNKKDSSNDNSGSIPGLNNNRGLDEQRSYGNIDDEEDEEPEEDKNNSLYKTNIPWSINLKHSFTYANNREQRQISNNSLMASANVSLTPKWKVNISSGYDFKNKGITFTNLGIDRDLDSWNMNISWTPFGNRESWFFFIGVKSGILRDLKYEKRREPDKRL